MSSFYRGVQSVAMAGLLSSGLVSVLCIESFRCTGGRQWVSALWLLPIHQWHPKVVLSWLLLNYWLTVSTYSLSFSQTSCAWLVYFRKVVIKMEKGSEGHWRRIQFGHVSLRYSVFCFVVLGIKPKALHMPGKWFATEPDPHPLPTRFLCRGLKEAVCGALETGGKQHLL